MQQSCPDVQMHENNELDLEELDTNYLPFLECHIYPTRDKDRYIFYLNREVNLSDNLLHILAFR